jgi:hypothetical protein
VVLIPSTIRAFASGSPRCPLSAEPDIYSRGGPLLGPGDCNPSSVLAVLAGSTESLYGPGTWLCPIPNGQRNGDTNYLCYVIIVRLQL